MSDSEKQRVRRRPHIDVSADTSDSGAGASPVAAPAAAPLTSDAASSASASSSSDAGSDERATLRGVVRMTLLLLVFGVLPVFLWRNFGRSSGERVFTPEELAQYDGENGNPIYLAVRCQVFDVTAGRGHYGKGAGYSGFAGRDASRAFVTGCYTPRGLTHDLRGFDDVKRKAVSEWLEFYQTHKTYKRVGRVVLPKIDPNSPLPDDCVAETIAAAAASAAAQETAAAAPTADATPEPLQPPSSTLTPLQASQQRAREATLARAQQETQQQQQQQ